MRQNFHSTIDGRRELGFDFADTFKTSIVNLLFYIFRYSVIRILSLFTLY